MPSPLSFHLYTPSTYHSQTYPFSLLTPSIQTLNDNLLPSLLLNPIPNKTTTAYTPNKSVQPTTRKPSNPFTLPPFPPTTLPHPPPLAAVSINHFLKRQAETGLLINYLPSKLSMPQRKTWTQGEDRILRFLRQQQGQKKWSLIARRMESQFGVKGRTGKQCRERYHNHLDHAIVTAQWSPHEQEELLRLHEAVGNRWSLIAQSLPGRSDNCVKNHFYSKLRRAVRKLNKVIVERYRRERREIKMALLYRVIETTEERFRGGGRCDQMVLERCVAIKNGLFRYADHPQDEQQLIDHFEWFERRTKRPAKEHKSSTDTNATRRDLPPVPHDSVEEPFYLIFKRVCEQIMLDSS